MTYNQTIAFLYAQLPAFTRIGKAAYKEDLHNIIALCEFLGNPQTKFKSIHVAGTNGKGSTSHMLASILQKQGYTCGLYTSPHIKDFGERIRINGEMISKQFVISFVKKITPLFKTVQPSFFEVTVAMAFEYFAKKKVDITVIETGLGGRLDSTNIINPVLSIITNIDFDHMDILGNTLEKIAAEKAGIIKENTPVVIGEKSKKSTAVFKQKAKEGNAAIFFAEDYLKFLESNYKNNFLYCHFLDNETKVEKIYKTDLVGSYQNKNTATVLCAVNRLNSIGYKITDKAVKEGLANVKTTTGLTGRWQILITKPLIITDVAHNAAGIKQVMQQLHQYYPQQKIHFILGFVKDKSLDKVIPLFPKKANYYFTQAHTFRALEKEKLQELFKENKKGGEAYEDVNLALAAALNKAEKNDVIMICGSFYIIAEIENYL